MEYHLDPFTNLGSAVDIAIEDKKTHKIIAFIEVEGHSHYAQKGQFNCATEWKHTLLQGFAAKHKLAFGIVGNAAPNALTDNEIFEQLRPFLNSLKPENQRKEEQDSQKESIATNEQPTNAQPETEKIPKKAFEITELSQEDTVVSIEHNKQSRQETPKKAIAKKKKPKSNKQQSKTAIEPIIAKNYKQMGVYAVSTLFAVGAVTYGVYKTFNQDREPL